VHDELYQRYLVNYFNNQLEFDSFGGDPTSECAFGENDELSGVILVKEDCVLSGIEELIWLNDNHPAFENVNIMTWDGGEKNKPPCWHDGDEIEAPFEILKIKGNARQIALLERHILNFLSMMCGVATQAGKISDIADEIDETKKITSTRKGSLFPFSKKACLDGTLSTHRVNLSNGILIKDTHLDTTDIDLSQILERALSKRVEFIEVEVESFEQIQNLIDILGKDQFSALQDKLTIMLDNFSIDDINRACKLIKDKYSSIQIEASGGITEDNLTSYIKTPVDIISMGSLSYAKPINLSFKVT